MQSTMLAFINDYGYLGVFLLIFFENIFPPVPSEVVLVFAGFLTTQFEMSIPIVILSATLGATLGAAVLYLLGRLMDRERIKRLLSGRLGQAIHLRADDVTRAEFWFKKYEKKAVFFCRCIPVVRSLISIPAGMAKMNLPLFFTLTLLGTAVWNTLLVMIGVLAGGAWEKSLEYLDLFSTAVIAFLAIVVVLGGLYFLKRRFIDPRKKNDGDK